MKYYGTKKITSIYRGGNAISKVYKGTQLVFQKSSGYYLPLHRPAENALKIETVDVNENPLGNQPVMARYYRTSSVNIEYSYDNISWTSTTSTTIFNTSPTGVVYVRSTDNRTGVTNFTTSCNYNTCSAWKVGDTADVYWKVEGDTLPLLGKNQSTSVSVERYGLGSIFSNKWWVNQNYPTEFNSQLIRSNIIIQQGVAQSAGGTVNSNKIKTAAFWNRGQLSTNAQWEHMFDGNESIQEVQLTHKTWTSYASSSSWQVKYPEKVTFWIPQELPETYGNGYLPTGCIIKRYNVDDYGVNT